MDKDRFKIEKTTPRVNIGQTLAYHAILIADPSMEVGFIGGQDYGDVEVIEVLPEYRSEHIASELFTDFVNYIVNEKDEKTISLAAANERSLHLMSKIPNIKAVSFERDGRPIEGMTFSEAEEFLHQQRAQQFPDNPDGTDELSTPIRVTVQL